MKSHKMMLLLAIPAVAAGTLYSTASTAQWVEPSARAGSCVVSPVTGHGCAAAGMHDAVISHNEMAVRSAVVLGPSIGTLIAAAAPEPEIAPEAGMKQQPADIVPIEIISPVPEPATYATLLAGLAVFAALGWRQRRKSARAAAEPADHATA